MQAGTIARRAEQSLGLRKKYRRFDRGEKMPPDWGDHLEVFHSEAEGEAWLKENDPRRRPLETAAWAAAPRHLQMDFSADPLPLRKQRRIDQ